jgi:hypothetical protein
MRIEILDAVGAALSAESVGTMEKRVLERL